MEIGILITAIKPFFIFRSNGFLTGAVRLTSRSMMYKLKYSTNRTDSWHLAQTFCIVDRLPLSTTFFVFLLLSTYVSTIPKKGTRRVSGNSLIGMLTGMQYGGSELYRLGTKIAGDIVSRPRRHRDPAGSSRWQR